MYVGNEEPKLFVSSLGSFILGIMSKEKRIKSKGYGVFMGQDC